ncbi:MAG: hypothetical protein KJO32_13990, partial [Deltaproteobacteria bacterium]|nr:hypothetical protein [Deltaproteobacteria bacterium]
HHSLTATERPVIGHGMFIGGEVTDISYIDSDYTFSLSASYNSLLERRDEQVRKDCQYRE